MTTYRDDLQEMVFAKYWQRCKTTKRSMASTQP